MSPISISYKGYHSSKPSESITENKNSKKHNQSYNLCTNYKSQNKNNNNKSFINVKGYALL